MLELEREKAKRARALEAAEKRLVKISRDSLDRVLKLKSKLDKMAVEIFSTRNILGHYCVLEKFNAIQKAGDGGGRGSGKKGQKSKCRIRSQVEEDAILINENVMAALKSRKLQHWRRIGVFRRGHVHRSVA
ncbi:hypothetical protein EVAR_55793_1 [Eumeta japonica]|uniref:Uncharacterized protein n=1 Tax=Eumeta variegata TaxID=151549 RepID=A0A4C1YTK8_EUMVA|nr:hypothetical protein EVAR_55793_1 [Eumeta japonica]